MDDGGRESGSGMIDAALDLFNETPKSHLTAEQSTGHGITVPLQYCSVVVYVESICWKGLSCFPCSRVASCRVRSQMSCRPSTVVSPFGSKLDSRLPRHVFRERSDCGLG